MILNRCVYCSQHTHTHTHTHTVAAANEVDVTIQEPCSCAQRLVYMSDSSSATAAEQVSKTPADAQEHSVSRRVGSFSEFGRVGASLGEEITTTHSIDIRASTSISEF